jgi:hypothetical protein
VTLSIVDTKTCPVEGETNENFSDMIDDAKGRLPLNL